MEMGVCGLMMCLRVLHCHGKASHLLCVYPSLGNRRAEAELREEILESYRLGLVAPIALGVE